MEDNQLGLRVLNKDVRALSRSITLVENNSPKSEQIIADVFPHIGKAHIIGITGPPGSGKSTLINTLLQHYRNSDLSIAVLAIDPTSSFTGGAILGDRIRMLDFSRDTNVYIRSMATRGRSGGLSFSTFDTLCLLDGFGFDKILIETVGAGQNEIDIYSHCDSTIVVTVPGLGDDIQSIKAGIYEIPDIIVVNKSDLGSAEENKLVLQRMLDTNSKSSWKIPIQLVSSLSKEGFIDLIKKIEDHRQFNVDSGQIKVKRRERIKNEVIFKLQQFVQWKLAEREIPLESSISHLIHNNHPPSFIARELLNQLNGD